jgi:hypothetical protein
MSRVTLAFMQDTGWYDVNWAAAGHLDWGYGAGCDFALSTCGDFADRNPGQPYFCTENGGSGSAQTNAVCAFGGLARARCERARFADGCGMKMALYAAPNCLAPQYATSAGDQFGWRNGPNSRCYPVTWLFNNYEYQFPDANWKEGWKDAVCYESACTADGARARANCFFCSTSCFDGSGLQRV